MMVNATRWPRPKHLRAWTSEELCLLRDLAQAGSTAVAIAERSRRTANAVKRKAYAHGITLQEGRRFRRAWV